MGSLTLGDAIYQHTEGEEKQSQNRHVRKNSNHPNQFDTLHASMGSLRCAVEGCVLNHFARQGGLRTGPLCRSACAIVPNGAGCTH